MTELLVAGAIVALALGYVLRHIWKIRKGQGCGCSGGCGASEKSGCCKG